MVARKLWARDWRDMIWINCKPQAGREMKRTGDNQLLFSSSPE